jgi:chemotaxis protein MotB
MTTYGDLVTQLLIFFVLLFAMSSIDAAKFEQAIISLQGALGFLPSGRTTEPQQQVGGTPTPQQIDDRDLQQMLEVKAMIEQGLEQADLEATVLLTLEERGLVIRFSDSVLFDLGRAEIKPLGRETLERISQSLLAIPNQVRIEGHTDNIPIRTAAFPSNWELSTARATNVVRYMIEQLAYDPKRLSAAGYGEYRPIATNDTPAGRQFNRRVDVVVLYTSRNRLEPK